MRRACLLGICLIVLVGCSSPLPNSYGKIVYALTKDKSPSGKVTVYEKDLDSGKVSVLIPRDGFPKEFKGYVSDLNISPDGRHLMITEVVESSKGKSDADSEFTERLWVWARESKSFRLAMAEVDGGSVGELMGWSPGGDLFGVGSQKALSVYSLSSGNVRKIKMSSRSDVTWSARDDRVIVVWTGENDVDTVYEQPLDDTRPRPLFHGKWIRSIREAPDRSVYAVALQDSISLVNRKGRRLHPTPIRPGGDTAMITDLCFGQSARGLAVVISYAYGEPHIHDVQQLWSVDVNTGKSVMLDTWEGTQAFPFWSSGDIGYIKHSVAGWSSDEKHLLVHGEVQWETETGDLRFDRDLLSVYSVDRPKSEGRELFDSGKGCTGFTWWCESPPQ